MSSAPIGNRDGGGSPVAASDLTADFLNFLGGDRRAFSRIVEALWPAAVQRRSRWALKSLEDREDAAQNAFKNVIRSRETFDRSRDFSAWFGGILENEVLKLLNKGASRRKAHDELGRAPELVARFELEGSDEDESSGRNTSTRLPALDEARAPDERVDQVRRAAELLPSKHRKVIELHYFEGYTHSEAADLLGCPIGTFASRMRAAQEELRSMLVRLSETKLGHATEVTYFLADNPPRVEERRSA